MSMDLSFALSVGIEPHRAGLISTPETPIKGVVPKATPAVSQRKRVNSSKLFFSLRKKIVRLRVKTVCAIRS